MAENNDTMKIMVQESDKMLMQELDKSVPLHWSIINHSLRILLLSMALGLGALSVVLVVLLVLAWWY